MMFLKFKFLTTQHLSVVTISLFTIVNSQNDTLNSTEIFHDTPLTSTISLNEASNSTENEGIVIPAPQDLRSLSAFESSPPEVFLLKCVDYKDNRLGSNELVLKIPGNLTNTDESVNFGINNLPTKLNCGKTNVRTLKWENGIDLARSKSGIKNQRLKASGKTIGHFTHDGYLHFDGHYYQPDEYCIKSVSDTEIEVETCEIKCSDADKICIPKCCGVDEVLEYWNFTCRKVSPQEREWLPKLSDPKFPHEDISYTGVQDRVRFKRQHLNCNNFERWPLTQQIGALNKSKYDMGIMWKLTPNGRPVYMSDHDKWESLPEGVYCVDGFANWGFGGNGTYSGNVDNHSVILLCPTSVNFPQPKNTNVFFQVSVKAFDSSPEKKNVGIPSTYSNALVFTSMFFLLAFC